MACRLTVDDEMTTGCQQPGRSDFVNQTESADGGGFHPKSPVAEMQRLNPVSSHGVFFRFGKSPFRTDKPGGGFRTAAG